MATEIQLPPEPLSVAPPQTPVTLASPDAQPGGDWATLSAAEERKFLEGLEAAHQADIPAIGRALQPGQPAPAAPAPTPAAKPTSTTPRLTRPGTAPATATPAAPPSPAAAEDEAELAAPIPEFKGAKAAQWESVHAQKREYLRRAVAAEDALKTFRTTAAEPYKQQLSTLQAERDKYEAELARVALERSPKFQAEFQNQLSSITGKVSTLLPIDKQDTVAKLLAAPASDDRTTKLERVMESLSPIKQRAFADAVVAYDAKVQERSDRISQSIANWESDQQRAVAEREAKLGEARSIYGREHENMLKAFSIEGNQEHNARVENALAQARKNFEQDLPMSELAQITLKASLHPVITELAYKLSDRVGELEAEIARLRGSEPGVGSAAPESGERMAGPDEAAADIQKYGSAGAAMAADMARLGITLGT